VEGTLQVTPGIAVGQVVAGKYRIDSVIGEGGMGYVVAAHHLQLETRVAIKLLKPELSANAEAVARFGREARAAVRIVSQHVARVFDVGTLDNGAPYMVMEYLEGADLANLIAQRGPFPIPEAIDYVLQACEAISEAHAAGVVHRDLKPANLFCVRRPDGATSIKVLDFGISKMTGTGANSFNHTKTTAIMGSPFYMSPEQMESTRGVDTRTDIWGLGVILYELVTARTPFEGAALPEICLRVATQQPPSMRSIRAEVPPNLELAILKCLEKDRDKRYSNVAELAIALRDFATPRGRHSVDNIVRALPSSQEAVAAATLPAPSDAGAKTIEPFGSTHPPITGGKGKTVALVLGIAGVVVAGVVVALRVGQAPNPSQAAAQVLSGSVPRPLVATAAAPPLAVEPTVPEPSLSNGTSLPVQAAQIAASGAPAVQAASPKKQTAPAVRTPGKARPSCDPNFYLDAQGEKHFKPECFR
jgi:serine/threonine-protein kinase